MSDKTFPTTGIPRVCYEIFVRSFCDSNRDGIGDLNGITSKLDYLQELGIEAIWISPIQPSPSYHKYDVTDYYGIDREYGTLEDFKNLLTEVHKRGMALYMDLVINHTSSQHDWFKQARKDPNGKYRQYYWWMDPDEIEALGVAEREITDDAHVVYPWHSNKGESQKYYAMFWKEMPDLNYDYPPLREEVYKIVRYWLQDIGVDGFRLDAARHIYPTWMKEKNPVFWEEFGKVAEAAKPGAYTVGEVWAKAQEVAPYFKGLKANFHFDLSTAIQKMIRTGRDAGTVEALIKDYALFGTHNPDFIDATMITNHDQVRIGSIAQGNIAQMKLAAVILLTLPGQPYIYYGEEIGMLGVKPDEHIREPFLWTDHRSDPQRALWQKPKYSRRRNVRAVSMQTSDPDSLLNHYKHLINLRKRLPGLGQVLHPNLQPALPGQGHRKYILAYYRPHPSGPTLIINNLSNKNRKVFLDEDAKTYGHILFQSNGEAELHPSYVLLLPFSSIILSLHPEQ